MTILSTLAIVFGTIMAVANLPQAYKIFKRKSAKDISMITYLFLFIGAIVWILYGIEIKSLPLIFSNAIGILVIIMIIFGWFMYGREK